MDKKSSGENVNDFAGYDDEDKEFFGVADNDGGQKKEVQMRSWAQIRSVASSNTRIPVSSNTPSSASLNTTSNSNAPRTTVVDSWNNVRVGIPNTTVASVGVGVGVGGGGGDDYFDDKQEL